MDTRDSAEANHDVLVEKKNETGTKIANETSNITRGLALLLANTLYKRIKQPKSDTHLHSLLYTLLQQRAYIITRHSRHSPDSGGSREGQRVTIVTNNAHY